MPRAGTGKKSTKKRARKKQSGGGKSAMPKADVYTLKTLDQVKVLADPLRVRILESLCEERTTKQVADFLGERPTKLYHHVDALEKAGVIRLTRTRQNRGTLEKYYLAIARAFRMDPQIFSATPRGKKENQVLRNLVSTVMDGTTLDLHKLIDTESGSEWLEEDGFIRFC
jgi:DNA-binding transcriptional ArsR family regulator